MRVFGFSTGALALGDFSRGVELQQNDEIRACELSALREDELDGLLAALPTINLGHFHYLSFHAPSSLHYLNDAGLVEKLRPVIEMGMPIVVHPDIIQDFRPWKQLGDLLLLENMDSRKRVCQTARDMAWYFEMLPQARLCFDIGHARQIDPTMSVGADILLRFRKKLAEVHISEVNWQCRHVSISTATKWAFRKIAKLIPRDVPVIIESLLSEKLQENDESRVIAKELAAAKASLKPEASGHQKGCHK